MKNGEIVRRNGSKERKGHQKIHVIESFENIHFYFPYVARELGNIIWKYNSGRQV